MPEEAPKHWEMTTRTKGSPFWHLKQLSFVFLHYPFRRNKVLVDDADDGAHGKKGEGEHVKAFAHLIK